MKKPALIFAILCTLFLGYSFVIYRGYGEDSLIIGEEKIAAEGKLLWQKYNCQSCHQFYGLGGYLGPDLTNVYSKYQGNEAALELIIGAGNNRMPPCDANKSEIKKMISFLKLMNRTGVSDPSGFKLHKNGMISNEE